MSDGPEGFDVIGTDPKLQVRCRECGKTVPIFPVSRRRLERAAVVHRRDGHDEGGVRVPHPDPVPSPLSAKAAKKWSGPHSG